MAKDKNSFLLYTDITGVVSKLSNEQAGILFKHILDYVNDKNPTTDDILIEIAFEPIKAALKRDLRKYENIVERNRDNGKNGGRPRKEPKKPSGLFQNPNKPKKADNDNDSDNGIDNDNDKNNINIDFSVFWSLYPNKVAKVKCEGKWNRLTDKERQLIIDTLPGFLDYKPFKGYNHPNPEAYFNQKRWLDVIPQKEESPFPERRGFVA